MAQGRLTGPAKLPSRPGSEAPAPADRGQYSIRVTSRLTGVELDTLRMWERRYGFPRPQRASGGSRLYSEADVEALKLIGRAIEHGYRPGEVVGKSRAELMQLVLATSEQGIRALVPSSRAPGPVAKAAATTAAPTISALLDALGRDDLVALRSGLRQSALALGPKMFLVKVVHPICVEVGQLWADGKLEVRHEHLLSECLSAQLRVMMAAYEDRAGAPRVLLATLPGERHGLGLEMIEVYLAVSQVTPVLIGIDTPAEQIVKAAQSHGVDAVGLLITQASDLETASSQLRWMLGELPRRVAIWVGGAAGPQLKVRDGLTIVSSWADLEAAIGTLPRQAA